MGLEGRDRGCGEACGQQARGVGTAVDVPLSSACGHAQRAACRTVQW